MADDYIVDAGVDGIDAVRDFRLGFVGWWAEQLVGVCSASEGGEGARGGGVEAGPGVAPGSPIMSLFCSISDVAQRPVALMSKHGEDDWSGEGSEWGDSGDDYDDDDDDGPFGCEIGDDYDDCGGGDGWDGG